jgi:hypothetical protein
MWGKGAGGLTMGWAQAGGYGGKVHGADMTAPLPQTSPRDQVLGNPRLRRLVFLTMVLLLLWFSGPGASPVSDGRGRRRLSDPKAQHLSPGGWNTGLSAPARARRGPGAVNARICARRRPGRRG